MINEKQINKIIWLMIFSSLLYLLYILVNYCLRDIQQFVFIKESGHTTKARYMLNLYFAVFSGISALWSLVVLVLFLMKKKCFRSNIVNLYVIFSFFLVLTFLIDEYFIRSYSFYFIKSSDSKLLLFSSYSLIYSMVALMIARSRYIKKEFVN